MFDEIIRRSLILKTKFNENIRDNFGNKMNENFIMPTVTTSKKLEQIYECQDFDEKKIRHKLSELRSIL